LTKLTLPLSDILNAYTGVEALSQKPLPPKSSIRVARLLVVLDGERRTYELARSSLIERLGTADPDAPGRITIPADDKDAQAEYWPAIASMQETEITLDVELLAEDDLVEIAPKFVAAILPFLASSESKPRKQNAKRRRPS